MFELSLKKKIGIILDSVDEYIAGTSGISQSLYVSGIYIGQLQALRQLGYITRAEYERLSQAMIDVKTSD